MKGSIFGVYLELKKKVSHLRHLLSCRAATVSSHPCKLFAGDSKLVGSIKNDLDAEQLQDDLNKLVKWSIDWRMLFNPSKFKVMHIGQEKTIKFSNSTRQIIDNSGSKNKRSKENAKRVHNKGSFFPTRKLQVFIKTTNMIAIL